jgi:hypothetical protein
MSDAKEKVIKLLSEAEDDKTLEAGRKPPWIPIIAIILSLAILGGYLIHRHYEDDKARAETLMRTISGLKADMAAMEGNFRDYREMHLYTADLQIERLNVSRTGGTLHVSGRIRNNGRRPINDMTLTFMIKDRNAETLNTVERVARSSDGKPLYRGQKRDFRFDIENPGGGRSVSAVITGIDFE